MELEFNGIDVKTIEEVLKNNNVDSEIFPLASRDTICPRENLKDFGDGSSYYLVEESCWHGYYFCGGFNCGRTSHRSSGSSTLRLKSPTTRGKVGRSKSRSSNCSSNTGNCNSDNDCDSSDSLGAIVIILLLVAVLVFLIAASPIILPALAAGIELGLAFLLGAFNFLTFGLFRKKLQRTFVHLPKSPSSDQLDQIIRDIASFGGLPRGYHSRFGTNGFWLFRTGAYMLIPSLVGTILVVWLQPENDYVFRAPLYAFGISVVLLWLGNFLINRKAKKVSSGA